MVPDIPLCLGVSHISMSCVSKCTPRMKNTCIQQLIFLAVVSLYSCVVLTTVVVCSKVVVIPTTVIS